MFCKKQFQYGREALKVKSRNREAWEDLRAVVAEERRREKKRYMPTSSMARARDRVDKENEEHRRQNKMVVVEQLPHLEDEYHAEELQLRQ